MKFIKVTNSAKEVNRLSLEKLGLSTKRENVETIGQFGSGIKFAPIAAIRMGLRWIFTGSDSKGDYTLEYIVKDDEGIPCIFYKYQDYEKPSSFTADAGVLSWEDSFQIIREIVANAIDEATISETDWSMTIVDESEIKSTHGEFSVFITADDSVMEIYNDFDKYFSVNKTPIYNVPGHYSGFKIYEPIDEYMRVYCKGILVYSTNRDDLDPNSPGKSSIYDYEFSNLELNEERTVKSMFDLNHRIGNALARIEDNKIVASLITNILEDTTDSSYEFNQISEFSLNQSIDTTRTIWKNMFENMFPKHVIVDKSNSSINNLATIKGKGFTPVVIENDSKYKFLSSKGVPTALNTIGESFKYNFTTEFDLYPNLLDAIEIVTYVFEDAKEAYPNKIGVMIDGPDDIAGITLNYRGNIEDKMILISEKHAEESNLESLVATLIHELDHFMTGADDGDITGRAFRSLADERLAKLAIDYFKMKVEL